MRAATVIVLAVSTSGGLFAGSIPPAHSQTPEASASQEQTLVPRAGEKPSFNCGQAKTAAARLICADGELARLDGELGAAFRKRRAQMSAPEQAKFGSEQLAWIRDRNARCELIGKNDAAIEVLASSKPCMVSTIRERIAFLAQTDTATAPAGAPPSSLAAPTGVPKSWTQIISLTGYAKQIRHRWVKYGAEGNQTSYIDLASIIREGDTVGVLDMQDWNPPIEVATTGEHLGSSLSLVRYDCGSTPRSMIMAGVNFHGNMGSGSPQDGAADVPKEPPDGWHVMQVGASGGSGMFKARDIACNYAASPSSQPLGATAVVGPAQIDNVLAAALANCDQQAQQQTAAALGRKSIEPTDILAWPLLLNDLATRRQQEADQPRLLAAIEQQRQQCRTNAEAAATQRMREAQNQERDRDRGYQRVSVDSFALDGRDLAAREAKVSLSGAYISDGNVGVLYADTRAIIMATHYPNAGGSNQPRVPLLTDDASRDFRQRLLACQTNPASAQVGCPVIVLGLATMCKLSNALGAERDLPCVAVEDGRW
jgi:uncharacterized protein YecT (DUF1311 family)